MDPSDITIAVAPAETSTLAPPVSVLGSVTEATTEAPIPTAPVVRPAVITITAAQHESYLQAQRDLATREEADRVRVAAEEKAEEERLTKAGELSTLLKTRDTHIVTLDRQARESLGRFKATTITAALALALTRHSLTEGSADQLMILWRAEMDATEDGDQFVARAKDGRTVDEFVTARLAEPVNKKFVAPKGGGGGPPTRATTSEQPVKPDAQRRQAESLGRIIASNNANPFAGIVPSRN